MKKATLPMKELISLSQQLALVVDSDLSLQEGMSLIAQQTRSKSVRQLLARTEAQLNEGNSLGDAFAHEKGVLPDFYISMVTLGEKSGNLARVLSRVADTYEKDSKVSAKVMSAVTYPVILAVLMICVIVLLLVEVLPMFDEVLASVGGEMPGITRVLMDIGSFIGAYFYVLLAIIAAIIIAIIVMRQTKRGAYLLDAIKLRSPLRRGIIRNIACVRFSRSLAMLIRSGIGLAESVRMTATTMVNLKLKDMAEKAAVRIEQGETLKIALASLGLFSGLLLRMLAVAEGTGHTDDMLDKAADSMEEQLDERLARLSSVLEPALIIVLSVIVGIVLVSVILPVTRIMNAVG